MNSNKDHQYDDLIAEKKRAIENFDFEAAKRIQATIDEMKSREYEIVVENVKPKIISDINAAYLYAQLEVAEKINNDRLSTWETYRNGLQSLEENERIELPFIPEYCAHNAHMFYIKAKDLEERTKLISFIKEAGIGTAFHYVPLHTAPAGIRYGTFFGEDKYTTKESERLVRLPMYYGLEKSDAEYVVEKIKEFYK
jgi:dTDP-4-amino-4,6-dideoxygalactose transaminase